MESNEAPTSSGSPKEAEALQKLVSCLSELDQDTRLRLLDTVSTFFGIRRVNAGGQSLLTRQDLPSSKPSSFSADRDISPKEFMMGKEPKTDIERVACLAFYLTHYRNTPHFKTIDISKLNTEAAQVKFSNAAVAVDNATKRGFLVPATKGNKQLGAVGEQFVQALPDRDAAKLVLDRMRRRKAQNSGRKLSKKNQS